MFTNNFFQDVPDNRILLLHEFLGSLDGSAVSGLLQTVIDEWFEKFEGHPLGKATLMQFQFGANHDDRTPGIVHPFSQQVLAETALFSFESIGKRFERPV